MTHLDLEPKIADAFQVSMTNAGWNVVSKEAGQVHILGWGYTIEWQKEPYTVILYYKALQTKIDARLALSPGALPEIQSLIKTCL